MPENSAEQYDAFNIKEVMKGLEIFLFWILVPLLSLLLLFYGKPLGNENMIFTAYFIVKGMIVISVVFMVPIIILLKVKERLTGEY